MAYKRKKMGRKASRRNFTRNATRSHPKNNMNMSKSVGPMRGGIRL